MQQRRTHKTHNRWKVAFITFVVVLFLGWLIPRIIFSNRITPQTTTTPVAQVDSSDQSMMDLTLTRDMVQRLLNQGASQLSSVPVTFEVNDSVIQMSGSTPLFGMDVPYTLATVPYVTVDGNIQLKIQSIQLSGITVPIGTVLSAVEKQATLPSWFELNRQDQYFTLKLSEIQPGTPVIAKKIDLKNDEIVFSVGVNNDSIVKYLE